MAFSVINKGSLYQNNVLYTGNDSGQSITGVGFQPDIVWNKSRTNTEAHNLWDSVRGTGKGLTVNSNTTESTWATGLTSFDSDGFTVGSLDSMNDNNLNFVAWNWKMGTTSGIAGSPSITPTAYSFNATAGQSIIKWTGTGAVGTLPHGLGVAPTCIIIKNIDGGHWQMYHASVGNDKYMSLSETDGERSSGSPHWNNTSPTATLFTVGTHDQINKNTESMIAYCFTDVAGYSRFSDYSGNDNANGAFCYLGFKPHLLIWKGKSGTGSADNWEMQTGAIDTYNPMDTNIYPNLANAESDPASTTDRLDFLSNGFKVRTAGGDYNKNGSKYIYMAWGQPIISNSGVNATAR